MVPEFFILCPCVCHTGLSLRTGCVTNAQVSDCERTSFYEKWLISDNHRRLETFFTFVIMLFGEFKCCLLPYGRRYTSPLSSSTREFDKTEYKK